MIGAEAYKTCIVTGNGDEATRRCVEKLRKRTNIWTFEGVHKVRIVAHQLQTPEGEVVCDIVRAFMVDGYRGVYQYLGEALDWIHEYERAPPELLDHVTAVVSDAFDAAAQFRERWNSTRVRGRDEA